MKIINTDNFNRDYPNESVVADNINNRELAEVMCKALIEKFCSDYSPRYYKVVEDNYVLAEGFEP